MLIEVNRSLYHPQIFSEYTDTLLDDEKQELIRTLYLPYREAVENDILRMLETTQQPVHHLSIHSFTPVWEGVERAVDIGLLFDPDRLAETRFCQHYKRSLQRSLPTFSIRFNEPYQGVDDGFTTYLRTRFSDDQYSGVEIEINQKFINTPHWPMILQALAAGCKKVQHGV